MKKKEICYFIITCEKKYKKGLIFIVAKTLKDMTNYLPKLAKVFHSFFYKNNFIRKKALMSGKKLRTSSEHQIGCHLYCTYCTSCRLVVLSHFRIA